MHLAADDHVLQTRQGARVVDFATRREKDGIAWERTDYGASFGLGLNWIVTPSNLLLLQGRLLLSADTGRARDPLATAMWAFAWKRARLGLGVAVGTFPIRTGESEWISLPVYPVADLWMRL